MGSRTNSVKSLVLPPKENYGGSYSQQNVISFENSDRKHIDRTKNRGDHNQRNQGNRRQLRDIGFKKLEEIYVKDSDEIICILEKQELGFDKMLQNEMTPDKIILIMRLVKKLCGSAFKENTGKILALLCCKQFLDQLKSYIQDINIQDSHDKYKNKYFWNDPEQFWESILIFFETLINVRPNTACDCLPKLIKVTVNTIQMFEQPVSEKIKEKMEDIQTKLIMCQEEREKKTVQEEKMKTGVIEDVREPPDNFR